ncbi:hypothetical protein ACW9HQ_51635, partial [Nocardia gipuzkoensis]
MAAASSCSSHNSTDGNGSDGTTQNTTAGSQAPRPPHPTLTKPDIQPPPLHNQYTNSGRPDVAFDPCTWIPDDAVQKAGFDPASRKRGDDQVAEETFLVCTFSAKNRTLSVVSGNVSWNEDLT